MTVAAAPLLRALPEAAQRLASSAFRRRTGAEEGAASGRQLSHRLSRTVRGLASGVRIVKQSSSSGSYTLASTHSSLPITVDNHLGYAVAVRVKVTTVEAEEAATDDAAENLAELVGALALTARVDRHLAELLQAPASVRDRLRRGTVVLDPPRSGAGGAVTGQLVELAPANIVYVACDPVALARDTKTLRESGYELTGLRAFDIFPHTHHFESLAVFERE